MFVAVAENESLRKAAEKIFKTQPTVTSAIKKMEMELGIDLFSREQYRVSLTKAGEKLYPIALQLLNKHQELKQVAHRLNQGFEAKVTIAVEASFDLNVIVDVLGYSQQHFPSTELVLQQEYMSGSFEKLLDEEVELAISPLFDHTIPPGTVDVKTIYQGQFVNVASPQLIQNLNVLKSIKQLVDKYQIIVRDSGSHTDGKQVGVQQGQRAWYVNNFEAKLLLIRQGMGWGNLPLNLVKPFIDNRQLEVLSLEDYASSYDVDYQLMKLNRRVLGPVATQIWAQF